MTKKKIEKEWRKATKHLSPSEKVDIDENGRPNAILYNEKTGRPLFRYRHPNLPLFISIISLLLVLGKPVLLDMLQWLQKWLFQ